MKRLSCLLLGLCCALPALAHDAPPRSTGTVPAPVGTKPPKRKKPAANPNQPNSDDSGMDASQENGDEKPESRADGQQSGTHLEHLLARTNVLLLQDRYAIGNVTVIRPVGRAGSAGVSLAHAIDVEAVVCATPLPAPQPARPATPTPKVEGEKASEKAKGGKDKSAADPPEPNRLKLFGLRLEYSTRGTEGGAVSQPVWIKFIDFDECQDLLQALKGIDELARSINPEERDRAQVAYTTRGGLTLGFSYRYTPGMIERAGYVGAAGPRTTVREDLLRAQEPESARADGLLVLRMDQLQELHGILERGVARLRRLGAK